MRRTLLMISTSEFQAEVGSSALHVEGATSGRYIFSSGSGAAF